MLSFSHSVSHVLSDNFTHQTCEIPCEMVVVFTQYSYVFHMIISYACEILPCERHVKKITFSHSVSHALSEKKDRETFIIVVRNFLGYYQCYTRSWHPT